jgi:hypothetical protein
MNRIIPIVILLVTLLLLGIGLVNPAESNAVSTMFWVGRSSAGTISDHTPEEAVRSLINSVKARRFHDAYSLVANTNQVDETEFTHDLRGTNGSLRTYSNLQDAELKVLHKNDNEALIRTKMQWATAVGAFYDTRDLKVVQRGNQWKVIWPAVKEPHVPPQVIPVNYLRWDIIWRGPGDEWGSQNVEAPHVRLISMKALSRGAEVAIVGEVMNEDIVPAQVSVYATLIGKDGSTLAQEGSFDKMSHVLLPKEVSPFRIDFPGIKLNDVKSVRMQPNSTLVPASADPVIGVMHQSLDTDARGRRVLRGELLNESGQVVNIPHVLATYYNNIGQVIWVSDGYVDRALLPQTPVPFAVNIPDDLAAQVQSYRVTVNQYSSDRYQP